jgi:DegV family protein with EDD domain
MNTSSPKIAVVTDSTSDIPKAIAEELGIDVVPAILTMEEKTYRDGIDISRDEFYRRLPDLKPAPTTAVPSSSAFEHIYQERLDAGCEQILSIHVSAKFSGMINAANQAAQEFSDRIHIYDSQSVSLGLGFQVIEAAERIREGATIPSMMKIMDEIRDRIRLIAMLDTQDYLMRSGRVGWATANLGKMLRIRILIGVEEGEILRKALVRTRRKAINELSAFARTWGPLQRMAILHTAVPEEAKSLSAELSDASTATPLIVDATTLLGVHVGPAALGVAGLCQ